MKLPYLPALDGVRALAVGLVILLHWPFPLLQMPFGWVGVNIFFVLSGYLITRILSNTKNQELGNYLKQFYRNRLLRIFPLYYAYLFGIGVLLLGLTIWVPAGNLPEVIGKGAEIFKKDFWLLLTYLYNFNDFFHSGKNFIQENASPFFSHLWSLAIEEQYYLVFPFLVYFLPRKVLILVLALIIVITPGLRLLVGELGRTPGNEEFIGLILTKITIFHLDGFALGGILALVPVTFIKNPHRWFYLAIAILGIFGIALTWYLRQNGIEIGRKSLGLDHPFYQYQQQPDLLIFRIRYALTYTIINGLAGLLLVTALAQNRFTTILQSGPAVFTGKLTYGIYIFHFPVLAFFVLALEKNGIENSIRENAFLELAAFLIYGVLVYLTAWLSFRYFESWFLRRKRHFARPIGIISEGKTQK